VEEEQGVVYSIGKFLVKRYCCISSFVRAYALPPSPKGKVLEKALLADVTDALYIL
jgi:hypothetical protein